MKIYEYRVWEKKTWGGHVTRWSPIFATDDMEALEVVKTRVGHDSLIANSGISEDLHPLDQIRAFAGYGRHGAGVHVYDFCPICDESFSVGDSASSESHLCAAD